MGLTDKHLAYGDDIPQTQAEKDYHWALKDLKEQQPYDDCISRQAVINAINQNCIFENEYNLTAGRIKNLVQQMSPITPKEKTEYEHDHDVVKAYNDGQAYILDKIRAEIENDWQFKKFPRSPWSCGLRRAIEIIDKHLKEVEK